MSFAHAATAGSKARLAVRKNASTLAARQLAQATKVVSEALEPRRLLSSSPLAMYHFDENDGVAALDASGNGHTGTLSGLGVAWQTPGAAGSTSALSFDGTGGSVNIGNPADMNLSGTITLAAWVMPQSTSGLQDIIAHGYTSSPSAEDFLRMNGSNYEIGSWNGTLFSAAAPVSSGDIGAWVFLAGVYDGTNWNLYRNGQLLVSTPSTTGAVPVQADWSIGSDATSNPSDVRSFQGSIDEVYIDSAPLNQTQVTALMNATPPPAATNVTAVPVSQSEIDLTWTNNAPSASSQEIWRTTDGTTYNLLATLSAGATSYSDVGLPEATDFEYSIRTVATGSGSFSTPAWGMTFPAAPTNLVATAGDGVANLSWTNNSANLAVFFIYRSADGISFTQVATVSGSQYSYQDLESWNGAMNYYRVTAVDDGGESDYSNVASVKPVATLALSDDPATAPFGQTRSNYSVVHGQMLVISDPANGVLANDMDPNGFTLRVASYTQPANGTLTLNSDGTFAYTANPDFCGDDTFTYTATDDVGATSNTATVTISVTDQAPEALSQTVDLPAIWEDGSDGYGYGYGYGYGGYYESGTVSGTLSGYDADGDSLSFSASQPSNGSLQIDSSGNYTYTPNPNTAGGDFITFTASDGIKTSNIATLIIVGWHVDGTEDQQEGEPGPDGDDAANDPTPISAPNQHYSILQDQQLIVNSQSVLAGAQDRDTLSPDPNQLSVGSIKEQPSHGSLSMDLFTGMFTYTPDPSFSGRDWFTWQVFDGDKVGGYSTVFIDVTPMALGISIDNQLPGSTGVTLPNSSNNTAMEPYVSMKLQFPSNLPNGSTVTLSVDDASDAQVWSDVPDQTGSNELIGGGTGSYTWTVGSGAIPSTLDVLGANSSSVANVTFTLAVAPISDVVGSGSGTAATQPAKATQPATKPANAGLLIALDGTNDDPSKNTNIYQFWSAHYDGQKPDDSYWPGVGTDAIEKSDRYTKMGQKIKGDDEALLIERWALTTVEDFYLKNPSNANVPLDVIGYSRGAVEAIKLVQDLSNGVIPIGKKNTKQGSGGAPPTNQVFNPKNIQLRFVGLISPVMGPFANDYTNRGVQQVFWKYNIPATVKNAFQALDSQKYHQAGWNVINLGKPLNQQPATIVAPTINLSPAPSTNLSHVQIGYDKPTLNLMIAAAQQAGVPCH